MTSELQMSRLVGIVSMAGATLKVNSISELIIFNAVF